MIHASYYKPKMIAYKGNIPAINIDRAQSIDPTATLNRDKVEEIGRVGVVGYLKKLPSLAYALTQLEYGEMDLFQSLVNTTTLGEIGQAGITLQSFRTPQFDICAFLTDDDGTFKGTLWYPNLKTNGFTITIGAPDAMIERSFDLVGESAITWQGNNKYVVQLIDASCVGASHTTIIGAGSWSTYPDPVVDPTTPTVTNADYFIRVLRVRAGVTTELVYTTDYTYNPGTTTLTFPSSLTGDIYKIYYTATTYITGVDPFVLNDADAPALLADSASIYMYIPGTGKPSASDYIYRLQSVTLAIAFDREDIREIGNRNVVARGVTNSTVTATLGRILESFTIEEVLAGQVAGFGKIDVSQLTDRASIIVKIYEDYTKQTFKYGYKAVGLTPTDLGIGANVNAYITDNNTLTGEDLTITKDATLLGV